MYLHVSVKFHQIHFLIELSIQIENFFLNIPHLLVASDFAMEKQKRDHDWAKAKAKAQVK